MMRYSPPQMGFSFLPENEIEKVASTSPKSSPLRLMVTIDHRAWLELLVDEWWPVKNVWMGIHLGVNAASCSPLDESRIAVTAWIDPILLPAIVVPTVREGKWKESPVRDLKADDTEIHWPGPVPLFAIVKFTVATALDKSRLIAMVKGFANIELPDQPIDVTFVEQRLPASGEPMPQNLLQPPKRWNALRGAAAMAVWAVPKIDPWLDLLCDSLSEENSAFKNNADRMDAPWLARPVWRRSTEINSDLPLWTAIVEVFDRINIREEWRAQEVLTSIIDLASSKPEADHKALHELATHTHSILSDSENIDVNLGKNDPLGLALQLVLLRPKADQFKSWVNELPSMPPAVWWTGAILSGLLVGYRDLDPHFRGSRAERRVLALRTWRLNSTSTTWLDECMATLDWKSNGEKIQLLEGEHIWAEQKANNRGNWYRADFADERVRSRAVELAQQWHPSCVRRCLRLRNTELPISGKGLLNVDQANRLLIVNGQMTLSLDNSARLDNELDADGFRDWIARGSIAERLPAPPIASLGERSALVVSKSNIDSKSLLDGPLGLSVKLNFVTAEEEENLLRIVDSSPWSDGMARRVQHYGWQYDYKSRKINRSAFIGDLPEWAEELGLRLLNIGVVEEMPDQVIVNEYVGSQGISKHIDCAECFRGPVVTVSLCESWGMVFRGTNQEKFELVLERRSATVLSGPARQSWTHEIPSRKKELAGPRGRRVSLTFRKVDMDTTNK